MLKRLSSRFQILTGSYGLKITIEKILIYQIKYQNPIKLTIKLAKSFFTFPTNWNEVFWRKISSKFTKKMTFSPFGFEKQSFWQPLKEQNFRFLRFKHKITIAQNINPIKTQIYSSIYKSHIL